MKKGTKHTSKSIQKIRKAKLKNPTRYWLGKKRNKKTIEKIRKIKLEYYGKGNAPWNKGKRCPWAKNNPQIFKKGHINSLKQKEIARQMWLGDKNPRWKPIGSKRMNHGYILVKIDEHKWVKEEWIIAEKMLGRKLYRDEVVHHINGNKNDNRPENLRVMTKDEHKKLHLKDNLLWQMKF
jgi:hypothetical protein